MTGTAWSNPLALMIVFDLPLNVREAHSYELRQKLARAVS